MNCEELRTLVGAEPNTTRPDVLAHVEQCPECARYRDEIQAMDRLIYRALSVNVPAQAAQAPRPSPRIWRMAASLLVTAGLVAITSIWLLSPRESFAAEAIQHIQEESESLVRTSNIVSAERLEKVLGAARLRLKPGAAHVSYARPCTFRGHLSPHLVVQTEQGPVTVLVVPKAPHQEWQQVDEDGFHGVIVPAPRGVIVVLGQGAPVDAVASTVLGALEYL